MARVKNHNGVNNMKFLKDHRTAFTGLFYYIYDYIIGQKVRYK